MAEGLARPRVAELIVDLGLSTARRGSGYLVSSAVVLTAAHLVRDATSIFARFNAELDGEWASDATVMFADAASDIGAVRLAVPAADPVGQVEFGALAERAAVLPFSAVGFPRFKLRTEQPPAGGSSVVRYRDAAHLHGTIASLANWRQGTLELVADPPERDPDPEHSPWEGMSGAAVWCAGRIVGVVSEHHRGDGLNRLAATPFPTARRQLGVGRWAELAEVVGLPEEAETLVDVTPPSLTDVIGEGYVAQVEDIAPIQLVGREAELDMLTRFCAGEDDYQWWQAGPWFGKTALASWLVLHPPAGVRVVSFFITGRLVGQSDHTAYTRALVEQLAAITGDTGLLATNLTDWDGQRVRLLKKAARQVHAAGQRLLLVVDGLDEDRGGPPAGRTSIASLLPRRPPPGVRILVTSRPHPGIPIDVLDHPLRDCRVEQLSRSHQAREIELSAQRELSEHLASGDAARIDILGLLTAAGGGMTVRELAELTQKPRWEIDQQVTGTFGRSLTSRSAGALEPTESEPVLIFAHEALRERANAELAGELEGYRQRIKQWANRYDSVGWPAHSPPFVFRRYVRLLLSAGDKSDTSTLTMLAVSQLRHDRMLLLTSGDANALEEIDDVRAVLTEAAYPRDIPALVILTLERDRLASRGQVIPTELPAVWVTLGKGARAIALARSIVDTHRQSEALIAVATALVRTGNLTDAQRLAHTVPDNFLRSQGLVSVASAMAAVGVVNDAEHIARMIPDWYPQIEALTNVASALAGAGLVADAERIAHDLPDRYHQIIAFTNVATALAVADLVFDAERIAHRIPDEYQQALTLTAVAAAHLNAGNTFDAERLAADAERIAHMIPDEYQQALALNAVAAAHLNAGNTSNAERLAADAERIAHRIPDEYQQALALNAVAAAHLSAGNASDANRLAADAEQAARLITDRWWLTPALTAVAATLIKAGSLAEAEDIARSLADDEDQSRVLTKIAVELVNCGDLAAAVCITGSIPDGFWLAFNLTEVAVAMANAGKFADAERMALSSSHNKSEALKSVAVALISADEFAEAERIARSISGDKERAHALAAVATALANRGQTSVAYRLATDAERTARTIQDHHKQQSNLVTILNTLIHAGNVSGAERIALSVPNDRQSQLLLDVVTALVEEGRLPEAERIAQSISSGNEQVMALAAVASALANAARTNDAYRLATDAERLALAISNSYQRAQALAAVAAALASAGRVADAERIVLTLDEYNRDWTLAAVASASAGVGQIADAERIALTLVGDAERERALAAIAAALARAGRIADAERIALELVSNYERLRAVTAIGAALASAGQIAKAEEFAQTAQGENTFDNPLAAVAAAAARAGHIADAQRIAEAISSEYQREDAIADVAGALTDSGNVGDAERIARTISNDARLAEVLAAVAAAINAKGHAGDAQMLSSDAERIAAAATFSDDSLRSGSNKFLTTMVNIGVARRDQGIGLIERLALWLRSA